MDFTPTSPRAATRINLQISFTCFDGFGREIQTKIQAEPGEAPERAPDVTLPTGDIQPGQFSRVS